MVASLVAAIALVSNSQVSVRATHQGRPLTHAVVWLAGVGRAKPVKASIVQKDKKFVPRILAVPVGSTVDFPNRDDIFHNVFAEFHAKKFDLGMYPKGQTRAVTLDRTGVVSVLCNVHSEMSAFIVVVDSAHYAISDKAGIARLAGVPPGAYDVEAWHESGLTARERVHIDAGAAPIELKLTRR